MAGTDGQPAVTSDAESGGPELVDRLAEEWRHLCDQAEYRLPFTRPEYFRAYVKAFEPGRPIVIATARVDGELAGVLPLVQVRESWYGIPITLLCTPRDEHYPWYDLVCKPGIDRKLICDALLRSLATVPGWDVVRLSRVDRDRASAMTCLSEAANQGWGSHAVECRPVPVISLGNWSGDCDWYLETRKKRFRDNLRQSLRRTAREGGLSLRSIASYDPAEISELYRLEAGGWKGRAGTAISCQEHLQKFYDEAAMAAAEHGYFRLEILTLGQQPIAAMYAFVHGGCYHTIKIGIDENYKRLSPGHLLWYSVLQHCYKSGIPEFNMGGSWVPWKGQWSAEKCWPQLIYIFRNKVKAKFLERIEFALRPVAAAIYHRFRPIRNDYDEEV